MRELSNANDRILTNGMGDWRDSSSLLQRIWDFVAILPHYMTVHNRAARSLSCMQQTQDEKNDVESINNLSSLPEMRY